MSKVDDPTSPQQPSAPDRRAPADGMSRDDYVKPAATRHPDWEVVTGVAKGSG